MHASEVRRKKLQQERIDAAQREVVLKRRIAGGNKRPAQARHALLSGLLLGRQEPPNVAEHVASLTRTTLATHQNVVSGSYM